MTKIQKVFSISLILITLLTTLKIFLPTVFVLEKNSLISSPALLKLTQLECNSIRSPVTCPLKPGDILLKREITHNTYLIEKMFKLYFTHSAIYIGNGEIVEAKGFEKNNDLEIAEVRLDMSSWISPSMESWEVLRGAIDSETANSIVRIARSYAASPTIHFGLGVFSQDDSTVSCSQLIWKIFSKSGFSLNESAPDIITPDYLHQVSVLHPERLKIVYGSVF